MEDWAYYLWGFQFWWTLWKPIAVRRLADEIDLGATLYIEDSITLWAEFPIEMDILERDFWAARGETRSYSPVRPPESPYRILARNQRVL